MKKDLGSYPNNLLIKAVQQALIKAFELRYEYADHNMQPYIKKIKDDYKEGKTGILHNKKDIENQIDDLFKNQ